MTVVNHPARDGRANGAPRTPGGRKQAWELSKCSSVIFTLKWWVETQYLHHQLDW